MEVIARYRGALLGLATGDALGTTLEFRPPGSFTPITGMNGGGPFHLEPGQWTDDTSMALCLAESLITRHEFNPLDQMERYIRWYRQGYLSSNGRCFDIGNTIREALHRFEETGRPFSGETHPFSAGNGSLMRLAPVPMFYGRHPMLAIVKAGESSRTTHSAIAAIDACRYLAGLIVGALNSVPKFELLSPRYTPVTDYWQTFPLIPEIAEISEGTFKTKQPPEIVGTGYVVNTLEAALWAFYRSDNFCQGALMAANLGDDADTTTAVYGQLAGAYYGEEGIPSQWREKLTLHDKINSFAEQLYALAMA